MPLDVEVVKGKKHTIQLADVNVGEVFKYDGVYYVMMGDGQQYKRPVVVSGVSPLQTQLPWYTAKQFNSSLIQVELVNATLTIND